MISKISERGETMVREAKNTDLDGVLHLYTQLHDNEYPEDIDLVKSLWLQIIEDKNHYIVVAEKEGKIVSSCVIVIINNLTHGQRPYALIENVITDSEFRKKGLASACMEYAKAIAKEKNCYKIMLLTGSKEEKTLRFYENLGYNKRDKTAFIQWIP